MTMPVLRLRQVVGFPGNVEATNGIAATKANGTWSFGLDWSGFSAGSIVPTSPTNYVLGFDTLTNVYALVPTTLLGGGGGSGILDAPSDGSSYGRINGIWGKVAPLVSPAITGTPTVPTAVPGTNTTQIATTAFVLANGAAVPPATVAPIVDGVAAVGVATKYAREDHVHPSDTSRAPLASPTFTGTPAAPTATTGTNTTQLATTAFVNASVSAGTAGVASFNTRTGIVTLTTADVTGVGGALLASPTFTGTPSLPTGTTAVTQAATDSSTKLATTAFIGTAAVRHDIAQSLTATDQLQGRANVYAAPLDALAYSGMQINGSMEVDQPNAGASVAVAAGTTAHQHLMDSWWVAKTGTNAFSVQQTASVFPGYRNELKLTVTTAQATIGSDTIDIRQSIEGYRVSRLAWNTAAPQQLTVGFWVKSSVAGTLTLLASNSTLAASVSTTCTISTFGVAQFVTATFPTPSSGTWLTDNGAGIIISIRVAGTSSINIASTNGNTFEMTGLVVLPGLDVPSATRAPFIMRPYDQELQTCQRYFRSSTTEGAGIGSTTTQVVFWIQHQGMRASPTTLANSVITITDIIAANFTQSASAITINSNDSSGGLYFLGNFSGITAGTIYIYHDNTGKISFDARL